MSNYENEPEGITQKEIVHGTCLWVQIFPPRINSFVVDAKIAWQRTLQPFCLVYETSLPDTTLSHESENAAMACAAQEPARSFLPAQSQPLISSEFLKSNARYSYSLSSSPLQIHKEQDRTEETTVLNSGLQLRDNEAVQRQRALKLLGGGLRPYPFSTSLLKERPPLFKEDAQAENVLMISCPDYVEDGARMSPIALLTLEILTEALPFEMNVSRQSSSRRASFSSSDALDEDLLVKKGNPLCIGSLEISLSWRPLGQVHVQCCRVPLNVCSVMLPPDPCVFEEVHKKQSEKSLWAEVVLITMLTRSSDEAEDGQGKCHPAIHLSSQLENSGLTHDDLGFLLPSSRESLLSWYIWHARTQLRSENLVNKWGEALADFDNTGEESPLQKLCWCGIPNQFKETVCMKLSGASKRRLEAGPAYYKNLTQLIADKEIKNAQKSSHTAAPYEFWTQNDCDQDIAPRSQVGKEDQIEAMSENPSSSSANANEEHDDLFEDWVDVEFVPSMEEVWRDIELDVPRTFTPGVRSTATTEEGRAVLRRVLKANAYRNPHVGYCQGLNFVAGLLLSLFPEETAFWLLVTLCESINPGYYDRTMHVLQADIAALKDMMDQDLPDLSQHIENLGLPLQLIYTQWLLVCFVNCMPNSTAVKVLELVLVERSSDVTIAIAIAFLQLHRTALLETRDMQEVIGYLSKALSQVWDVDEILELAFEMTHSQSWKIRLAFLRTCHQTALATAAKTKPPESWSAFEVLNRCTYLYTSALLADGHLGESALAPVMLRGLQWAMGWKLNPKE